AILCSKLILCKESTTVSSNLLGSQASIKSIAGRTNFLTKYEVCYGQQVNTQKSSIYLDAKIPIARKHLKQVASEFPLIYLDASITYGKI
ncbi:hypothetical protein GIB67_005872, partial [Kingdonia uniflora]